MSKLIPYAGYNGRDHRRGSQVKNITSYKYDGDNSWTEERVEFLKKLWADGLSASQIATQLGGVSRNAVVGKVHRLNLAGRGRTISISKPKSKKTAPSKPTTAYREEQPKIYGESASAFSIAGPIARQASRLQEDIVVPISRKLKLVELTEGVCKWPNGDPASEEFRFCGNDSSDSGPYCIYHSRLAYQPASERRRVR